MKAQLVAKKLPKAQKKPTKSLVAEKPPLISHT